VSIGRALALHPLILSLSKDDNLPSRFDKLTMSGLLTGCVTPLVLSLSKDDNLPSRFDKLTMSELL